MPQSVPIQAFDPTNALIVGVICAILFVIWVRVIQ